MTVLPRSPAASHITRARRSPPPASTVMAESDSASLREHFVPGPLPGTGYRTALLLGTTGAGKTTLVRQLIGTDPVFEPFPATATFKTTTAETEVLCAPGIYYAVVTFNRRDRVREDVLDCVVAAGRAIGHGRPPAAAQDALRAHLDQRLRLEYVLGPGDESEEGWLPVALERIEKVVASADSLEDEDLTDHLRWDDAIEELVDDLLSQVVGRIQGLTQGRLSWGADHWPTVWTIASSDRSDFLSALRRLVGNDRATHGVQLSPLVDGVRVRGPFHPSWAGEVPYLMLVDTVGLGHTPDTAASLPVAVLDQLEDMDRIVLVDDATSPMQAAPAAALRQLVEAGHVRKIILCFTHLDLVRAPALRSADDVRALVRRSVEQVVSRFEADLDPVAVDAIRHHLDSNVVYLGRLDEPISVDDSTTLVELDRLLGLLRDTARPITIDDAVPAYRLGDLRSRISAALLSVREGWADRLGVTAGPSCQTGPPAHWSQVQALSQRLAVGESEGYGGWSPVADVQRRLIEAVRWFVTHPVRWDGVMPSDRQRLELFDRLTSAVGRDLLGLTRLWLVDNATEEWAAAAALAGSGSSRRRAELIMESIVEPFTSAAGDDSFAAAAIGLVFHSMAAGGTRIGDAVLQDDLSLVPDENFPAPIW